MMDEPGEKEKLEGGDEWKADRRAGVILTLVEGMDMEGRTKDGLKDRQVMVEVLESQASPSARLLFLPFKELHNFKQIMSALKQMENKKKEGRKNVCVWKRGFRVDGGAEGDSEGKRKIRSDNK